MPFSGFPVQPVIAGERVAARRRRVRAGAADPGDGELAARVEADERDDLQRAAAQILVAVDRRRGGEALGADGLRAGRHRHGRLVLRRAGAGGDGEVRPVDDRVGAGAAGRDAVDRQRSGRARRAEQRRST